eukprot:CAMPEP_0170258116 /NCGR_PEP_ID=MMETSP0116_2-20130129/28923_1 /TAXON_ID=400756 /ORGANISM="Durinskia baltica, Strain CSIRO CS-38" /LENGTH=206 /DNA_ID=CAMNT_0010509149 /DNA_START=68 /DNA_END=688 /DNA_ORIENTATION=-
MALDDEHQTFKVFVIGDSGVGKTALVDRLLGRAFPQTHVNTVSVDFSLFKMSINDVPVNLQTLDTAVGEEFRSLLVNTVYRRCQGMLLVFDVTDMESFNRMRSWALEVRRFRSRDLSAVVVGNKCDLAAERVVSYEEGESMARWIGGPYVETSAKHTENVERAFRMLIAEMCRRREAGAAVVMQFHVDVPTVARRCFDNCLRRRCT